MNSLRKRVGSREVPPGFHHCACVVLAAPVTSDENRTNHSLPKVGPLIPETLVC